VVDYKSMMISLTLNNNLILSLTLDNVNIPKQ